VFNKESEMSLAWELDARSNRLNSAKLYAMYVVGRAIRDALEMQDEEGFAGYIQACYDQALEADRPAINAQVYPQFCLLVALELGKMGYHF
jgi:hypothetical protein